MEDSKQSEALSLEQFKQIMDKLSRLDNQMEDKRDHSLLCKSMLETWQSEISILRHEMKQELDGMNNNVNNVIYKVSNIPEDLGLLNPVHMLNRDIWSKFSVFPLSRERTAVSLIRLSSSETPYGPNQRTFNVLLDLFVYFSLVPFCFWWEFIFFVS